MEIAEFIQKFFLLFLPGIVGMLVYNQINIREEQQGYVESLKLVCLSLASYLLTDALFWALRRIPGFPWGPVNIVEVIAAEEIRLPAANVSASVAAAVGTAFLLTMANDEGWTASVAERLSAKRRRRIEESRKRETEREAVWPAILEEGRAVVLQDFITKYVYYGRLEKMSDRDGRMEILLRDVRVIDRESRAGYSVNTVYLSRKYNEFVVEIQNPKSRNSRK